MIDDIYSLPRQPFLLSEARDPDPGLLATYAEYSGSPLANDLYGDLREFGV